MKEGPSGRMDAATTIDFFPGDPLRAAPAEAQALFLLAGWHRYVAGRTPLTLVSVNDPPDTVLALAERCGARVVVRTPNLLEDGTVFNRALSWNVPGGHEQRLVLASDVLIVGEGMKELNEIPTNCLTLAPADREQLPEQAWKLIYEALGLPLPGGRMRPLRVELNLAEPDHTTEVLPYYHSAVVVAPRTCELGSMWSAHLQKLARVLPALRGIPEHLGAKLARSGRVALSTACQAMLSKEGCKLQRLPRACDGRVAYFESAQGVRDVGMLHARNLFTGLIDFAELESYLQAYAARLQAAVMSGVERRGGGTVRAKITARWRVRPVAAALGRLYLDEVRPTLRRCGVHV